MDIQVNDRFETYYAEKLWEMIPAIYRHEDGLADPPGVLRCIIEVIAGQAAILRRSQDRLWEDQFIELCDDWAIPYIGELLATRLLSAQNSRGQRIDVAKTIYYRRRKGTPRILEELIFDISGWDGKLVEGFQRLARTRHGLDPKPLPLAGRYTATMPGGVADLRSKGGSELASTTFDEYFHTPDLRKPKGLDGRYGISKLNFYLYRLASFAVTNSTPFFAGDGKYTFDPSGRSLPLFNDRRRPVEERWDQWYSALEWELPLPIRCRLLAHAEYRIEEEGIRELPADFGDPEQGELRKLIGWRFRNEGAFRTTISSFPNLQALLQLSPELFLPLFETFLVADCGKHQLIPAALSVNAPHPVSRQNILPAGLQTWAVNGGERALAVDAERGRFLFLAAPPPPEEVSVNYHYGFPGYLGAGTYYRGEVESRVPDRSFPAPLTPNQDTIDMSSFSDRAVVQINDNRTYVLLSSPPPFQDLTFQAANFRRPYLVLTENLVFESINRDATLVLDGLWIGASGGQAHDLVIRGDFECVVIRNCTFDPGGDTNAKNEALLPVTLVVEGKVENLCIEKSITGPIRFEATALLDEELVIQDCIIQSVPVSPAPALPAILTSSGRLDIRRSTVYGDMSVHRLYASELIGTGTATVTDTQTGCFRFSAAPAGSRLPRPYESFLFPTDTQHWFTSRRFGQPGYGQLSETAPQALKQGAENGSEMGAFNTQLNAIKKYGLTLKVEEYMPFGLIPAFINQT